MCLHLADIGHLSSPQDYRHNLIYREKQLRGMGRREGERKGERGEGGRKERRRGRTVGGR